MSTAEVIEVGKPHERLTRAGLEYAKAHQHESAMARCALHGNQLGRPAEHVDTAVRACNRAALEQ